jgi:PAS domain S-box-containing protein
MAMKLSERRPIRGMEAAARGDEGTPVVEELYLLTDRLYHAETPNDIYEAGLDAITRALGCSRASVLLSDHTGIMRFAAWRGLSDAYRRAVEGHSPWPRDIKDPQPVCIHDVHTTDFPEPLKDTIKAEQIGALAFFPLVVNNALIGKFTTYYDARHVFSDAELALALTIARQLGFSLQRRRAEEALRATQRQLVSELAASRQLQKISTQLIYASDAQVLYEEILDAAVAIMRSEFASMQMLYPERGELRLLAYRGFNPTAAAFWEWVRPGSGSTCGAALATGNRSIVPDIELSDFMAGSEDLETYRQTGIRAVQSTPLVSRAGRLLGMISTHWRNPHQPSERDLSLLDVLARQAADLIERKQAELTDQRLAAIVDSSHDAIVSKDLNGIVTTWNRGAERLFGYAASEMIGRSITTLIPPDRHHEEVRILDCIRRGERVDPYETVRKRMDGSLVDVSVSVSPVRNAAGEVIGASKIARDITDRKRAEADLAERQSQLAVFVEHAPAAIAMFDREMRYLAVSRRYILDFRLPQGTQLIGRSHYEVFPDIPQRWRDVHARVLAGEELSQAEDQFTRHDGCTHWVRWSMAPWRRADGSIGGALLFSEHRTEQVEARRALIDSEARFRATFENAAVGVAVVDTDGSILRANNSFARMLGYSLEELKTRTFQEVTHPDDLATSLTSFNKALVGEADSYSIEKRYARKDGGTVWASLTVGCVRKADGGIHYFVSVIQDITDRKRAEARLAERNAQLDLAGKIARIGSFTYDHPTKKLQLSPGCAAIYGLPESTREISREDWRARVHPDDLLPLDTVTRRAVSNGERECILEFRIFRHGQVRWIESRILISYNEAGKPVRTIGSEIDVTERKQAELALAERNMQFALAGKAARVGSYAYDVDTDTMQVDEGYAALHRLPGTSTTRSEWKTRAHPEDLDRLETVRSEAFRQHRSEYGIEYRIVRPGGEVRWIESRSFMSYNNDGHPQRVVGVNIDITERKQVEEQQRRLVAELDHRVKNVLSTVQAVAAHTMDASSSMEHFVAALDGRIRSLGSTHELLSDRKWQGIPLKELVQRELAPYATASNADIDGPEVMLSAEAGQTMGMVLHELVTNAAKYGALSAPSGRVSIRWRLPLNGSASERLVFKWQETGGPRILSPSKSSYGMNVVREIIPFELGGTVEYVLSPEGARCQLDIPLTRLSLGSSQNNQHPFLSLR